MFFFSIYFFPPVPLAAFCLFFDNPIENGNFSVELRRAGATGFLFSVPTFCGPGPFGTEADLLIAPFTFAAVFWFSTDFWFDFCVCKFADGEFPLFSVRFGEISSLAAASGVFDEIFETSAFDEVDAFSICRFVDVCEFSLLIFFMVAWKKIQKEFFLLYEHRNRNGIRREFEIKSANDLVMGIGHGLGSIGNSNAEWGKNFRGAKGEGDGGEGSRPKNEKNLPQAEKRGPILKKNLAFLNRRV